MAQVHPTAIVEAGAELAESVVVGPYSTVSGGARIGENVTLHSHVVIGGSTTIGSGSEIFPSPASACHRKIANIAAKRAGWTSAETAPSANTFRSTRDRSRVVC
jgi:acyl-[acyl carrier protein]--UDP-N-acetylglucosamine O-acyltransferase